MDATFPLYLPRFLGHSHFQQPFNVFFFFFFFFFTSSSFEFFPSRELTTLNEPFASNTAYTLRNTLFLATFFVNSSPTPNLSGAKLRDTINFRRLMNTHLHFGTKLKEESFECNVYVFQVKQLAHLLFLFLFLPENK